jgi:DUF4097 and DUF4098 domain-containing protein YvlB
VQLAVLALTAALLAGCSVDALQNTINGSFDRTLQTTGPVDLSIRTGSGSINIQTGAVNAVRISGRIRAREGVGSSRDTAERVKRIEANPPIDQRGGTIRIGEGMDPALLRNITISYDVTVPPDTRVHSQTGSGDQIIGDVQGPVSVATGSGTITAGRIGGAVNATTGSGDIVLAASGGRFDATTGSGSIRATAVGGAIKARTGSGRIEVAQVAPGEIDATTGSGNLAISGAQGPMRLRAGSGGIVIDGQPTADWNVRTGSGSVKVRVPATASFALDAETGSGSIDIRHPRANVGTQSKRRVTGTIGSGGPRVDLSTTSGDIRLD